MATKQVIARDLAIIARELRELEKAGRLDPVVASLLKTTIRLVELLRRQTLAL